MNDLPEYDFGIVGAGAAGLQLLLAILDKEELKSRSIVIIDRAEHIDKTWCYWEEEKGKYDDLVSFSWSRSKFYGTESTIDLELGAFRYKMLRSRDLLDYAKEVTTDNANVRWIHAEVSNIGSGSPHLVSTTAGEISVNVVFDSRATKWDSNSGKHPSILQHFKGRFIRTSTPVFDPSAFTMMDYRLRLGETTSFMYVLPTSTTEALVEFTLFTPTLINEHQYDEYIDRYCKEILKVEEYEEVDSESGIIPMTTYPFHLKSSDSHVLIGTAGGWVKPGSGYSFAFGQRISQRIANALVQGVSPNVLPFRKRSRFFDRIFLRLLLEENHLGPDIFTQMYRRNDVAQILKFLDEKTTAGEDLGIINSFKKRPFIRSFWRDLMRLPMKNI